tara:strand:- start:51750 stop:52505 length:756 start_codon:yes stop_codon:yes gene_type:complete
MARKVISFSLFGGGAKYCQGMLTNMELKQQFFPDWEIMIYHDDSVPDVILGALERKGATLKNVTGFGVLPASWRFLAYDEPDVERFICRDADSRLSQREAVAVKEWEDSDKQIHIMRDHPHHGSPMHGKPILGGMWGMKVYRPNGSPALADYTMYSIILDHQGDEVFSKDRNKWFWTDMWFLRDAIYASYGNEYDSKVHAARDYMHKVKWCNEPWAEDFPTKRNEQRNFVGEVFIFDENGKEKREWQYKEI